MKSRRAPIDEGLAQLLSSLAERQRQVIELRCGLQGVGPLTLQQVGMRLSLTREGVRYIQDKGIGRLRNDNDALRRVLHPLRRAVAAEGGVADLHNITEEVFGRSPSDSPVDFLRFLLTLDERFVEVGRPSDGLWARRGYPVEMIPAIQAFGLSELRGARAAIGIDKLVTRIMGELAEREVDRRFVRAALKVCPTVSITDDGWCFSGPRRESRKGADTSDCQNSPPAWRTVALSADH